MKRVISAGVAILVGVVLAASSAVGQQGQGQGGRRGGFPSFEEMDRNGDGKITADEFAGPPQFFQRLDANNDGAITKEEMDAIRQGGRGGAAGPGGQGFSPEEFEQRMLDQQKSVLKVTDEEWTALKPLIKDVLDAQRATQEFRGMRSGFGRPGGGAQAGATGGGVVNRPNRSDRGGPRAPEVDALRAALESPETPADTIKGKLSEFRAAQQRSEAKLKAAREKLREALTARQEAQLVLMGTLD